MWNLRYHINEHIYETETDTQTSRTDVWLPRGQEMGVEEGSIGSLGLVDENCY